MSGVVSSSRVKRRPAILFACVFAASFAGAVFAPQVDLEARAESDWTTVVERPDKADPLVGFVNAARLEAYASSASETMALSIIPVEEPAPPLDGPALAGNAPREKAPAQKPAQMAKTEPRPALPKAVPAQPAPALDAEAEVEVEPTAATEVQLNTTGKPIGMSVPLKDGSNVIGDVSIKINPDGSVLAAKTALVDALSKLLDGSARAKLAALPDQVGMLALADLAAAGFTLRFDSGLMELVFEPKVDQRTTTELSLLGHVSTGADATFERPEDVSGYLNLFGGLDHAWQTSESQSRTSLHFEAESVFRLWDVVAENDFGYDGEVNTFLCPADATCTADHNAGLKRRASRLVYDLPDEQLRFQLGDTTTFGAGFQSQPDLLGMRIEHAPHIFAPNTSTSPTGRTSFKLERPSDVDVSINGSSVQHLKLGAGNYNLKDLPLQTGANAIQLKISDDNGGKRTLDFSAFSGSSLLAEGVAEWSASAGLPSYLRDNERDYLAKDWIATLNGRYGLSDQTTGEANFQGDSKVLLGGAGVATGLPLGFLSLQGAVSQSASGFGYAGTATYELNNVEGLSFGLTGRPESLRLAAEYRSDAFRTPGEFQATASGILRPQSAYSWRFSGSYSVPLTNTLSASLSGRYQIGNDDAFKVSPLTVAKDRYGLDLSFNAPVTDWMSGSLSLGYGNDGPQHDVGTVGADDPAVRVGFQFTIRPDEKTNVNGSYDSLHHDVAMNGSWNDQKGYEHWDGSADSSRYGETGDAALGASIGYTGNRGEVRVSHTSGLRSSGTLASADQRSSVRAGAAIAFAGGRVAVGAPVRGNGFAIIAPHQTIAGKTVKIGDQDDPRALADSWGPALVGNLPAYMNTTLPVDVDDLPAGYSLGKGGFDLKAPYRAGYALEVGSAYSVSAYGTLHDVKDAPVALLTGTATSEADKSKQVAIFTNAAGKFGADGLAPGRWIIEMATDPQPSRFILEVPKGANGLFKAGVLKPHQAASDAKTS